jgi:hypothetical protein
MDLGSIMLYLDRNEMSAKAIPDDIMEIFWPEAVSDSTMIRYLRNIRFGGPWRQRLIAKEIKHSMMLAELFIPTNQKHEIDYSSTFCLVVWV